MENVSKVLVYSPNLNPELRERMREFAKANWPTATQVSGRTTAFFKTSDIEQADAVVVLPENMNDIGRAYLGAKIRVLMFAPNAPAPPPVEPPALSQLPSPPQIFVKHLPDAPVLTPENSGLPSVKAKRKTTTK